MSNDSVKMKVREGTWWTRERDQRETKKTTDAKRKKQVSTLSSLFSFPLPPSLYRARTLSCAPSISLIVSWSLNLILTPHYLAKVEVSRSGRRRKSRCNIQSARIYRTAIYISSLLLLLFEIPVWLGRVWKLLNETLWRGGADRGLKLCDWFDLLFLLTKHLASSPQSVFLSPFSGRLIGGKRSEKLFLTSTMSSSNSSQKPWLLTMVM